MVAFLTLTLQSMCDVTQGIIDLLSCFSWCVRPVPWPSVGMGAGASTLGAQGAETDTGTNVEMVYMVCYVYMWYPCCVNMLSTSKIYVVGV